MTAPAKVSLMYARPTDLHGHTPLCDKSENGYTPCECVVPVADHLALVAKLRDVVALMKELTIISVEWDSDVYVYQCTACDECAPEWTAPENVKHLDGCRYAAMLAQLKEFL